MRREVLLWPRTLLALGLLAVCPAIASAYTIVMRDGRRLEIPVRFIVTETTLTYEVSPGFQVTMPLAAINVTATEQANGETAGSFLRRKGFDLPSQEKVQVIPKAHRTITNRELQAYAQTRVESETAYEQRRRELGLPSAEESRRRREVEADLIRQELNVSRLENVASEAYWRSRGSELRAEIAAVDAEITYVRARIDEVAAYSNSNYTVVSNVMSLGVGGFGRAGSGFGRIGLGSPRRHFGSSHMVGRGPRIFAAPAGTRPLTARVGFQGGTVRARAGFSTGGLGIQAFGTRGFVRGGFGQFAVGPPVIPFQNLTSFGTPYDFYDGGYQQSALMVTLDELVGRRAGLRARWRDLEEEARRAGVPPGWLRP